MAETMTIDDALMEIKRGTLVKILDKSTGTVEERVVRQATEGNLFVFNKSKHTYQSYWNWLDHVQRIVRASTSKIGIETDEHRFGFDLEESNMFFAKDPKFMEWVREYHIPVENVAKAFDLWIKITGVDPNATTMRLRDFSVQDANADLKESLELDQSKFTTMILLDAFSKEYFAEKVIRVQTLLEDYDKVQEYLALCHELSLLLQTEEIEEYKDEFKARILSALTHYQVDRQDVIEMANDPYELAYLWRDALRAMRELEVHQFMQGEATTEKPVYYTHVHEFWNVNSLIRSLCNMDRSGITLSFIREPHSAFSYFVFGIRNGGTVSILTDKPDAPHPLYQSMSRRPEKEFTKRAFRYHFPFGLMGMAFNGRGDAYLPEKSGLVPYQQQAMVRDAIANLNPDEVIWTLLMYSLIEEKFFKQDYKAKELSYTGEMVRIASPYEEEMNALAVTDYKPLEAKKLTPSDVSVNAIESQVHERTGMNDWLEKRYEHLIDDELLNLVGIEAEKLLLPDGNLTTKEALRDEVSSPFDRDKVMRQSRPLTQLASTSFGTQDEVLREQMWIARYNKAQLIVREAAKEYKATHKEIFAWYKDAVQKNLDTLLEAVARGEFLVDPLAYQSFPRPTKTPSNIVEITTEESRIYHHYRDEPSYGVHIHSGTTDHVDNVRCIVNGTKPSIFAFIAPHKAEDLAAVCGCTVSDMPEVLQHWKSYEIYGGNSILQRLDPMDWSIKDPWRELQVGIVVHLSKSGYNDLRKKYGLPPNKFWIENKAKHVEIERIHEF